MKKLFVLLALLALVFSAEAQEVKIAKKKKIIEFEPTMVVSVPDFEQKMHQIKGELVIDLRTKEEFEKSHIDGAENIPFDAATFEEKLAALDKTKTLLLYTAKKQDGKVTPKMFAMIFKAGFEAAFLLDGGFEKWTKANKPLIMGGADNSTGF